MTEGMVEDSTKKYLIRYRKTYRSFKKLLWGAVGHIRVISDGRKDRVDLLKKEIDKLGDYAYSIEPAVFVKDKAGYLGKGTRGVAIAWLNALEWASLQRTAVLVLEDDVIFSEMTEEVMTEAMAYLSNKSWHLVFLTSRDAKVGDEIDGRVRRVMSGSGSEAVVINPKFAASIRDRYLKRMALASPPAIDKFLTGFRGGNNYVAHPMLAIQNNTVSKISGRVYYGIETRAPGDTAEDLKRIVEKQDKEHSERADVANIAIYGSHNATIALEKHGEIIGVIELERFLSSKNVGWWFYKLPRIGLITLWTEIQRFIEKEYGIRMFDKLYTQDTGDRHSKVSQYLRLVKPTTTIDTKHHECHAYSTFYQTDYKKAIVISFDGGGNDGYFNIYVIDRIKGLKLLKSKPIDMGFLYSFLGKYMSDIKMEERRTGNLVYPGKLMGLCAYGIVREEWVTKFKDIYLSGTGLRGHRLDPLLQKRLSEVVGVKFDVNNRFEGQLAWDISATAQRAFEDTFIELIKDTLNKNKDLPVCLTGGCALNIILNTRLKSEVKELFVAPNSNDCGIAVGMLMGAAKPMGKIDITYSGIPALDRHVLSSYIENNPMRDINKLAEDISKGSIVGVVIGNSEHGPRALGNRSILCNPLIPDMKNILNSKVKNREWYRPFAPVVRLEDVSKYFEWEGESRWMNFCPKVREEYKTVLPAITHVDGTARVQTVTKEQHEFLYNLLTDFEKITGMGVLLNTSFNVDGKPILSTYSDAWGMYSMGKVDGLVLEYSYFSKNT